MQTIDIIIAVLLAIGFIGGLRDGLVKQVAGLAGLIVGLLVGRTMYMPVGSWLRGVFGSSTEVAHIVAFLLILVIVPLLFAFVGWLISKFLSAISLGWLNRLLGSIVGALKYTLFVGVIITGIEMFDKEDSLISKEYKSVSKLYYPIHHITKLFLNGMDK